jgi:cytochrome c553
LKRSTTYKILSGLSLVLVLFSYNQCTPMESSSKSAIKFQTNGSKSSAPNTVVYSSAEVKAISVEAFKNSVYTITRSHCVACHGATQTPLHAVADVTVAHDAVIDSAKVNFSDMANSRLVLKLKDEHHNCWSGDCAADASSMLTQVTAWKDAIDAQAPNNDTPSTGTTVKGQITAETNTVEYLLSPEHMIDDGTVTFNAESGSLTSPMVKATENGVTYIGVPEAGAAAKASNATTGSGVATFSFNLQNAGTYRVWTYVNAPDANAKSAYVRFNPAKGSTTGYTTWTIAAVTTGFEWKAVTNGTAATTYSLPAGTSTMEIKQRDDGLKISRVIITSDMSFNPTVNANYKAAIVVPIDALSGVPGAVFKIDIENFDTYSYKVSNPRIITTTPLNVKNLKILINGSYNSQHATYTVVNKQVTAADPVVSAYTMVMLKDQGPTIDKLSFAFGYVGTGTPPADTDTTPTTTSPTSGTTTASAEAFKQTLWPVLRTRCASCHDTTQSPMHSNSDYNVAHTQIMEHGLVNFTSVTSSVISTKVKGGHHCWTSNCADDGATLETQINVWKNLSGK